MDREIPLLSALIAMALWGAFFATSLPLKAQDSTPTHMLVICESGKACRPYGNRPKPMSLTACKMDATGVRNLVAPSTIVSCDPIKGKG